MELEEGANTRNEFFNGEIYAMASATPEHAALAASVVAALLAEVRGGPCRVFTADLRVSARESGLTTYPDVTVVCGELARHPEDASTITNPTLIVEVLSASTAAYDRGEKLEQYKRIPSLGAVLLFSQTARRVEVHERVGGEFRTTVYADAETFQIAVLGATLSLASVYGDAGL